MATPSFQINSPFTRPPWTEWRIAAIRANRLIKRAANTVKRTDWSHVDTTRSGRPVQDWISGAGRSRSRWMAAGCLAVTRWWSIPCTRGRITRRRPRTRSSTAPTAPAGGASTGSREDRRARRDWWTTWIVTSTATSGGKGLGEGRRGRLSSRLETAWRRVTGGRKSTGGSSRTRRVKCRNWPTRCSTKWWPRCLSRRRSSIERLRRGGTSTGEGRIQRLCWT